MVSKGAKFLGARTFDFDTSTSCNYHLNDFHGDVSNHAPLPANYFSKKKKDRHCTYNIISRRVRATIVAVEKQKYYIF